MSIDRERLIKDLKNTPELIPDKHDGSYELVREIVKAYTDLDDYSGITYKDMDAVYHSVIGTWKSNVEIKKDKIKSSCLSQSEKDRLVEVIDKVWDKACRSEYSNKDNPNRAEFGMFGSGFMSFYPHMTDENAKKLIEMLIDISKIDDSNYGDIYNKCDEVLKGDIKGMAAGSASVILHCLKPNVFPIINTNSDFGTIYEPLGINLDKQKQLDTYISNCRKIKEFRDDNFFFKNYRILDLKARELKKYELEEFFPSLSEYSPNITTEKWKELISNKSIFNDTALHIMKCILNTGGKTSCIELSNRYGNNPNYYKNGAVWLAMRIQKETNCPMSSRDDGTGDRYWAIPFVGRYAKTGEIGAFIWKLRDELKNALEETDLSAIPLLAKEKGNYNNMTNELSKNTILYGPPGTGKTYNTARYAIAIIENKSFEEIEKEDYSDIIARYNQYKEDGLIEFTTFHQAYGYEEFIEGIRPVMDAEDEGMQYRICPGVFKSFCEKAATPTFVKKDLGLNSAPAVWKVSLEGTGDNPTRSECMANNHIRIGWDSYGENITDDINYSNGGKTIIDAFINKMRVGDIVFSCYTSTTIDAIGVVTGEYEWIDAYEHYKRVRNVKWLAKGLKEDITEINNGKTMTLSTVYQLHTTASDAMALLSKVAPEVTGTETEKQNYVFIIDEINRGNISKIFGELITLIEDTKRIGKNEGMSARLPYSKTMFGVPENVYIIGTMNTADRSIATLDTALRRRFDFVEMLPKTDLFDDLYVENISIKKMLDTMNKKIEVLYDREHTLGHAYFIQLLKTPTIDELRNIFRKKIIPLLQEYFFEDYEKIRLVLNDNNKEDENLQFIKVCSDEYGKLFGKTEFEFDDSVRYEINEDAFKQEEAYKQIYIK